MSCNALIIRGILSLEMKNKERDKIDFEREK